MTNTAKALYSFFSSFDIPAYVEYEVPDEAVLPYITYQLVSPQLMESMSLNARVWYRSKSFAGISAKVDEISAAIGDGVSIDTDDGGAVWLFKGRNFAQNMPMEGDDTLKCVYLSMTIHALTE